MPERTFLEAISLGLRREMERDASVVLLGEDIGVYGGAFKITEGFLERFGEKRVIDTPISEEGFVGAAVGMAYTGFRPVVEFQFIDFMPCAFDVIVNFAATSRYRCGRPVPITFRGPWGAGGRAGPFHSRSLEMWFAHSPGIKVVAPAFPADAAGLLRSCIRDNDPCLFLEHKFLYRRLKEEVPDDPPPVAIGKARVVREGGDLTLVSYGMMLHRAMEAAAGIPDVSVEVIDLRTIYPLDRATVVGSVRKTGKVVVVHEDTRTGGIAAELAAVINEEAFEDLDGPVVRVTAPDAPVPFAPTLEDAFLPSVDDIAAAILALHRY